MEWNDHLPFPFSLRWVSFQRGWLPASELRRPNLGRTHLSAKEREHSPDVTTDHELLSSGLELAGWPVSHSGQAAHWETSSHD